VTVRLEVITTIDASAERSFDCSRDIDLHLRSMEDTGERAIAGRTSGLIGMGEDVTWRARHFGVAHEHCSRITAFDRPRHFRDSMIRGRFRSFEHDHFFAETEPGVTVMTDVIVFASPLGPLGALVDRLVLKAYLRRLIQERNAVIKEAAESGDRAGRTRDSAP
jgi:ligand-binding SRPBCC domain-containing protein